MPILAEAQPAVRKRRRWPYFLPLPNRLTVADGWRGSLVISLNARLATPGAVGVNVADMVMLPSAGMVNDVPAARVTLFTLTTKGAGGLVRTTAENAVRVGFRTRTLLVLGVPTREMPQLMVFGSLARPPVPAAMKS